MSIKGKMFLPLLLLMLLMLMLLLVGWLARGSNIDCWWLAIKRSRDFQQLRHTVSSRTWSRSQWPLGGHQRRREGWPVLCSSFGTAFIFSRQSDCYAVASAIIGTLLSSLRLSVRPSVCLSVTTYIVALRVGVPRSGLLFTSSDSFAVGCIL